MPTDMPTLIDLLRDLRDEINACLMRENRPSIKDPIILGDFVVEAYNRYLAQAKEACEDPLVQALEPIAIVGECEEHPPESAAQQQGSHPRLQKMAEVKIAARSLHIILAGPDAPPAASRPAHTEVVLGVLRGLMREVRRSGPECPLDAVVNQYNSLLAYLHEETSDPVFARLFPPLHGGTEGALSQPEARMAVEALKVYVQRARVPGGRQDSRPSYVGSTQCEGEETGERVQEQQ
jgi:hypothetical protein